MGDVRLALVTGSARGIGRAIAEALAASGHRVVGLDVLEQEDGPFVETVQADLGDPAVPERIVAEHGPFDVLICNAALFIHQPLSDVSVDDVDRQVAVNFRSTFLLCQASVPLMAERGWGRVVTISSIGARTGGVSQSAGHRASSAHGSWRSLKPCIKTATALRRAGAYRRADGIAVIPAALLGP